MWTGRYGLIILLLVGIAIAIMTVKMLDTLQQMEACAELGTVEACRERGTYKPASDQSRPVC